MAEGQRRYVESLSAYARQFLDQLEKPDVDFIHGLSPAIAIEQRSTSPNPRSTVATQTEIYDYLRILFASIGLPHDPASGVPLARSTPADMIRELLALPERTRLMILAPVRAQETESFPDFARRLQQQGFIRLRADGVILELDRSELPASMPVSTEIVIDRIVIREDIRSRLADSLETALRWSGDRVMVLVQDGGGAEGAWEPRTFVTSFTNPETGFTLPEITPKHFSFNSHSGACPACHGTGAVASGSIALRPKPGTLHQWRWDQDVVEQFQKRLGMHQRSILGLARHFGADPAAPIRSLPIEFKRALLEGTGTQPVPTDWADSGPGRPFEGLESQAMRLHEESESEVTRRNVRRFLAMKICQVCEGCASNRKSSRSLSPTRNVPPRSRTSAPCRSSVPRLGWMKSRSRKPRRSSPRT